MQWMKALLTCGTPAVFWAHVFKEKHKQQRQQQQQQQQQGQPLAKRSRQQSSDSNLNLAGQHTPAADLDVQSLSTSGLSAVATDASNLTASAAPQPDLGLKTLLQDGCHPGSLQQDQQQQQQQQQQSFLPSSSRTAHNIDALRQHYGVTDEQDSAPELSTSNNTSSNHMQRETQSPASHDLGLLPVAQSTLAQPQGTIPQPQGSLRQPQGSMRQPQGIVQQPQGTILQPVAEVRQTAQDPLLYHQPSSSSDLPLEGPNQLSGRMFEYLEQLPKELLSCRRILQHSFVLQYYWQPNAAQAK